MVNSKRAASGLPPSPPVVATHVVVLYEAVCHSCGWTCTRLSVSAAR